MIVKCEIRQSVQISCNFKIIQLNWHDYFLVSNDFRYFNIYLFFVMFTEGLCT